MRGNGNLPSHFGHGSLPVVVQVPSWLSRLVCSKSPASTQMKLSLQSVNIPRKQFLLRTGQYERVPTFSAICARFVVDRRWKKAAGTDCDNVAREQQATLAETALEEEI